MGKEYTRRPPIYEVGADLKVCVYRKVLAKEMTTSLVGGRTTVFSVPAEPCASPILRRFVREIARSSGLNGDDITRLQISVMLAFNSALSRQENGDGARIDLTVTAGDEQVTFDLAYSDSALSEELVSRC